MSEVRKDPYRIRRSSKKEFSRVSSLLRSHVEALEKRVTVLEAELGITEKPKPRKRRRAKKPEEPKEEPTEE